MRKGYLLALAMLIFSSAFAETLSTKVILQNSYGYFVLSDGSLWKVMGAIKRWRNFDEWWNNAELTLPQTYACPPNDWALGTQVQIYPKLENWDSLEGTAYNVNDLKQSSHIFLNNDTGHVLFAIALTPSDCVLNLFQDAYRYGYNNGHDDGYQTGHSIANWENPEPATVP